MDVCLAIGSSPTYTALLDLLTHHCHIAEKETIAGLAYQQEGASDRLVRSTHRRVSGWGLEQTSAHGSLRDFDGARAIRLQHIGGLT